MNQNENAALVIKKYVLTEKTILYLGHTLHRIRAIRDFGNVKAGSLGGWIESEKNLFHRGNASGFCSAWVCGNAKVYGDARVCDDARVSGNASVSGNARVCGGKWEVSPYYIQGSIWSVNIASPNMVQCGCQRHTWKEWHDNYLQISREHNADHVLQEYIQYFNLLCNMYGHWACEINVPPTLSAGLSGSAQ